MDPAKRGEVHGYRSGLEDKIAAELEEQGITVHFETIAIPYTPPLKARRYTPDFPLANGIIIETKGRFLTDDRQKHKHIKDEHPDLDIRFVFSDSSTKLSSQRNKEFAAWLKKEHGLSVAFNKIPKRIDEKYRADFWETLPSKPSQTTYADWCEKNGFLYADASIPQEWLDEPPCKKRLDAIRRVSIKKTK